MKRMHLVLIVGALLLSACSRTKSTVTASHRAGTYIVELRDDRIVFGGIDPPSVVADLPGDKYEVLDKIGRTNVSRAKRCCVQAHKALSILRTLVKTADTAVLLNSFRPEYEGEIDYYMSRDGNLIIAQELSKRRPLPRDLVASFEAENRHVFLGISGPLVHNLDDLLSFADALEWTRPPGLNNGVKR